MATEIEIGMYVAQNPDVQQHAANTAAASGFAPGTPEYTQVFQKTAVDHAINFGTAEGRVGAQAVATTSPTENNAQAGTSTGGSQTMNFTAPPPPVPVDLAPVTSAISGVAGSIGTPETGQPSTLMGQTQGIREVVDPLGERIQGVRDVVDPLAGQVTGIGTSIGTAGTGQADTLMGQTADIQSGIGQAGEGQTDLFAGQRGIMSGIGTAGEGQTDLFAGQAGLQSGQEAMQATQAGLEAGQLGLGQQIGTAAVTGEDGTVTQQPTGLYAGQAGLMSGQTGLTQDISGLGRDLSGIGDQLSGDLSGLGGQLGAFRTAAEQYQRGATTQRGDIQGTQRAGQANLLQQIQGVGQQANRAAEAIEQQRQMQTQTQQPAVQQQAAQFARSAPRATPSNQQVGPMGPMATDPRDAIMQQLMANRIGLMNRGPV